MSTCRIFRLRDMHALGSCATHGTDSLFPSLAFSLLFVPPPARRRARSFVRRAGETPNAMWVGEREKAASGPPACAWIASRNKRGPASKCWCVLSWVFYKKTGG